MKDVYDKVAEETEKPSKKKKPLALVISLVAVAILGFLALLLIFGIPFGKYLYTINLMDKGQYKEAIDAFENMDGYLKSEEHAVECQYLLAGSMTEEGNYVQALPIFTLLGNYKDCAERVTECKYQITLETMSNGQYQEAIDSFTELGDYKDVPVQITECQYCIATKIMEEKNYLQAIEIFTLLGTYKDCADRVSECKYQIALNTMANGLYQEAVDGFSALGDYKDSVQLVLECKYRQAVLWVDEGKIVDAYEILNTLGDYGESASLLSTIKPTYQRIKSKPLLFVDHQWRKYVRPEFASMGNRYWATTKVLDSNTLSIYIEGYDGAADSYSSELTGVWDESIGMVKFSGKYSRTSVDPNSGGTTYDVNNNVVGYAYYENGYLCLVYGNNPDESPIYYH